MAEPSEEPADDDREEAIRLRLEGALRPGDRITAESDEESGRIEVRLEPTRSELAETHPELYGALRGADEAIGALGGCGATLGWLAAGGALAHAAERDWIPLGLAGEVDLPAVLFAMLASGWLGSAIGRFRRRHAYTRRRGDLREAIDRSGLSAERLLSAISGDRSLGRVLSHIARDPDLVRGGR